MVDGPETWLVGGLSGGIKFSAKKIAIKQRAFWIGKGSEKMALDAGFETIGETRAGRNLKDLIARTKPSLAERDAMWGRLGKVYAEGARGNIPVFQNATEGMRINNVFKKYEYSALLNNPFVTNIEFRFNYP